MKFSLVAVTALFTQNLLEVKSQVKSALSDARHPYNNLPYRWHQHKQQQNRKEATLSSIQVIGHALVLSWMRNVECVPLRLNPHNLLHTQISSPWQYLQSMMTKSAASDTVAEGCTHLTFCMKCCVACRSTHQASCDCFWEKSVFAKVPRRGSWAQSSCLNAQRTCSMSYMYFCSVAVFVKCDISPMLWIFSSFSLRTARRKCTFLSLHTRLRQIFAYFLLTEFSRKRSRAAKRTRSAGAACWPCCRAPNSPPSSPRPQRRSSSARPRSNTRHSSCTRPDSRTWCRSRSRQEAGVLWSSKVA